MYKNDLLPSDGATITPSDTAELGLIGFYVGGAGDVAVTTQKGTDIIYHACPVGTQIVLGIRHIKSTGTTATLITGTLP